MRDFRLSPSLRPSPCAALIAALMALGTSATGCSLGWVGDSSGGADNLPTSGGGPFAKPPIDFDTAAEEPYVVTLPLASLSEPSVLDRADGGFRLWFARQRDDEDEVQIWYTEIPSVYDLPDVVPTAALVADEDWEEGRVTAPAVTQLADGTLLMLYEGGMTATGIGMATSTDDGATWTKSDDNPIIADALTPGVADTGEGLYAVFMRSGNTTQIFSATSPDGGVWTIADDPIVTTRPDDGDAFDQQAVTSPSVYSQRTVTGRVLLGLHFGGINKDDVASIGYAASFDGVTWERYLGSDPVVSPTAPEETGPALTVRGPKAYLFFSEPRQLRGAIAVGLYP